MTEHCEYCQDPLGPLANRPCGTPGHGGHHARCCPGGAAGAVSGGAHEELRRRQAAERVGLARRQAAELDVGELDVGEMIRGAAGQIRAAVRQLEGASRLARAAGAPPWLAGQLDAYTIPGLLRFAGGEHAGQPGNLPGLLTALEGDTT